MDKQKLASIFKKAADSFTAKHQTDYSHGFDKGYSIVELRGFSNSFQDIRANFINDQDPTILSAFILQTNNKLTPPKHRRLWKTILQRAAYMETPYHFTAASPFAVFAAPSINLWRDFTKDDLLSWRLSENSFGFLQIEEPKIVGSLDTGLVNYLIDNGVSFTRGEVTTLPIPSYLSKWLEYNACKEVRIREYTIREHKFYAFATSDDFLAKDGATYFVGVINHTLHARTLPESELQLVDIPSDYNR